MAADNEVVVSLLKFLPDSTSIDSQADKILTSEETQLADTGKHETVTTDADSAEKERAKHNERGVMRKKHKKQRAQKNLDEQEKEYRKRESEKLVIRRASTGCSLNVLRSMRVTEVDGLEEVERIRAEKFSVNKGITSCFSRWKTGFFEYDRKEQTITYFKSEADDKPQGVFRLVKKEDVKEPESNSNSTSKNKLMHKMSFKSTNPRRIRKLTDFKKRSHVLEIGLGYADGGTEARQMYMSFPTVSDLERWARVLQSSESGYKKLPSRIKSEKNLKDLDTDGSAIPNHSSAMIKRLSDIERLQREAIPNLRSEMIKRLVDVERLQREGKSTQEAHDKLLPSVLEVYDNSPRNAIAPDEDVLVECSDASCGATTSTAAEVKCRECGAKLIVRNLVDVDLDPPEGYSALCSLPLDGGLFSVYYLGYHEVLDYYGKSHILYVVVCRWEKENVPVSQWICSYWYSGYRTLRKRLKEELDEWYGNIDVTSEDGVANGDSRAMLPKLPKRKTVQTADGIDAINLDCSYRTKYLSIFLAHILDMDIAHERDEKGNSVLLTLPHIDAFFEITWSLYDYDRGKKKKKKSKSSKKAKASSPTSSGKDSSNKKADEPLCGDGFDAAKTALETVTHLMERNKP